MRKGIGNRIHSADFQIHDGTVDETGTPTYWDETKWTTTISAWPCELVTTGGGELVRGRQVTAQTTHVLFGEYFGADGVTAPMRIQVNGELLNVVSSYDPDGRQFEMRVEARREQ